MLIFLFSQYLIADSLYHNGYYRLAQIEYQRLFFFDPACAEDPWLRFRFTRALIMDRNPRGYAELNLLVHDSPEPDPDFADRLARLCIMIKDYDQAEILAARSQDPNLLGLAYLLNNRVGAARDLFLEKGNPILAREIDNYLSVPRRRPDTAMFLSMVCPGTGEIYAGNIRLGIIDFLLNLGSGFLIYNALRQKKYVDAGLVIGFLFNRFYFGSLNNARMSAIAKNSRFRDQWLNSLKSRHFPDFDLDY
jgi:hypothetical protein